MQYCFEGRPGMSVLGAILLLWLLPTFVFLAGVAVALPAVIRGIPSHVPAIDEATVPALLSAADIAAS
jgi:hypothetical protein